MALIVAIVFATSFHCHSSLIFLGKARSLPLEHTTVRGSILVSSSLPFKY